MEIAVGLGREPGVDLAVAEPARPQVLVDDLLDEVGPGLGGLIHGTALLMRVDDGLLPEDLHHLEEARALGLAADGRPGRMDEGRGLQPLLRGELPAGALDGVVPEVGQGLEPVGEEPDVLPAPGLVQDWLRPSSSTAKSSRKKKSVIAGSSPSVLIRTR